MPRCGAARGVATTFDCGRGRGRTHVRHRRRHAWLLRRCPVHDRRTGASRGSSGRVTRRRAARYGEPPRGPPGPHRPGVRRDRRGARPPRADRRRRAGRGRVGCRPARPVQHRSACLPTGVLRDGVRWSSTVWSRSAADAYARRSSWVLGRMPPPSHPRVRAPPRARTRAPDPARACPSTPAPLRARMPVGGRPAVHARAPRTWCARSPSTTRDPVRASRRATWADRVVSGTLRMSCGPGQCPVELAALRERQLPVLSVETNVTLDAGQDPRARMAADSGGEATIFHYAAVGRSDRLTLGSIADGVLTEIEPVGGARCGRCRHAQDRSGCPRVRPWWAIGRIGSPRRSTAASWRTSPRPRVSGVRQGRRHGHQRRAPLGRHVRRPGRTLRTRAGPRGRLPDTEP